MATLDDRAVGLRLADDTDYSHPIGSNGQLTIDECCGMLDFDCDADTERSTVTAASLTPDEADSFARVLQAWAGRRRELDAKEKS